MLQTLHTRRSRRDSKLAGRACDVRSDRAGGVGGGGVDGVGELALDDAEMFRVFNMGIGMVVIVREEESAGVLRSIRAQKMSAWEIGFIYSGNRRVQLA